MAKLSAQDKELKLVELLILAAELGLAVSQDMGLKEVEKIVKASAKSLPEPYSTFSRHIALKYNIVFEGTLKDCFGYWEDKNYYCNQCQLREACEQVVERSSLGSLTNPAIKTFGVNDKIRAAMLPRIAHNDKEEDRTVTQAMLDRIFLLKWLDETYSTLVRTDYKESTTYHASNRIVKKRVLLRVENFTNKNYNINFCLATAEQIQALGLEKNKYGWYLTSNKLNDIKATIQKYLEETLDNQCIIKQFTQEEALKQELIDMVKNQWKCKIEYRAGYEIAIDPKGFRIIYFKRFTPKKYVVAFPRMKKEAGEVLNLVYTSAGPCYKSNNKMELYDLVTHYLESIKETFK